MSEHNDHCCGPYGCDICHKLRTGENPPTVTLPREQVERVLRVLERVENAATIREDNITYDEVCPYCWQIFDDGHAPDCELAASIADHRKALL